MVRGEAGIGKSALLAYLVGAASDLTVVRAIGVESEMELVFASLHRQEEEDVQYVKEDRCC